MITRAIVEQIVSPYKVKIRIPLLDSVSSEGMSVSKDNLTVATICTLPNCYTNLQVGDVVFVGFEDNTYYRAVILGHLCREAMLPTYADVKLNNLDVVCSANLPRVTSIGDVTSTELSYLSGVTSNIQKQITALQEQQNVILEKLLSQENKT